jgi:adenylate cyclase
MLLRADWFAYRSSDMEEVRLEKSTIFMIASLCCIAGLLWALMYYLVFGWSLTTILPILFTILVSTSLVVAHVTKNHYYAVYAQIICIIYITTLIQWSIGGVFNSGFVMAWAFCGPIVALIFFSPRRSFIWFGLYILNVAITVVFNDYFMSTGYDLVNSTRLIFFIMNVGVSSLVIFLFASYFVSTATTERRRADALLFNMLPREIAFRLKSGEGTIADPIDFASVLFVDMVESTLLFADLPPAVVVDWLNEIFSMFDRLVKKHGLEKIQTIGDGYMVAAGVPTPIPNHAQACTELALDMIDSLNLQTPRNGKRMAFRFGIHSGSLVAGVIGEQKYQYTLFGDTVNTASRMESHGEAGKVHVSEVTHALIQDEFKCISRNTQSIKGKGEMQTWFVLEQI